MFKNIVVLQVRQQQYLFLKSSICYNHIMASATSSAPQISSETISILYKSRNVLLQLLKTQGYNVDEYSDYGVPEVQNMYANKQLDMLLSTQKEIHPARKAYVKYHLGKTLWRKNLNEYIEDLYEIDQVLSKEDMLVIVMKQEMNDTLKKNLNEIWEQEGIFIVILTLDRLQFNILEHSYVPMHEILSDDDAKKVMKKYNISDVSQFPSISRYDPVAQAIGMRPGQICKITRSSRTAIESEFFRYCETE